MSKEFDELMVPRPLSEGVCLEDYWRSIAGDDKDFFSLAYQWQDKPHRHVFDLIHYARYLEEELKKAQAV